MKTISWQFPGMRKPDSLVIYPPSAPTDTPTRHTIIVQGERTIAQFDPFTRKGVLNCKGSKPKYFPHLHKFLGAIEYEFPEEFVKLVMDNVTLPGDEIGPGVYHATDEEMGKA